MSNSNKPRPSDHYNDLKAILMALTNPKDEIMVRYVKALKIVEDALNKVPNG